MKFRTQDYFRYKRIARKGWRRPKGLQSKLRISKGGSGLRPRIGFGAPNIEKNMVNVNGKFFLPVFVHNSKDLEKVNKNSQIVVVSASVGLKKTLEIEKKAQELGINFLYKKKLGKAHRQIELIKKNKEAKKKAQEKAKKEEKESKEKKTEAREHKHKESHDHKAHEEHKENVSEAHEHKEHHKEKTETHEKKAEIEKPHQEKAEEK